MLEELKEEEIVNKVGGRFKLSTLIQKRLVQLNAGSRALVDMDTSDKMAIVLQEIVQDKIYLDTSNEVKITGELTESGGAPEFAARRKVRCDTQSHGRAGGGNANGAGSPHAPTLLSRSLVVGAGPRLPRQRRGQIGCRGFRDRACRSPLRGTPQGGSGGTLPALWSSA